MTSPRNDPWTAIDRAVRTPAAERAFRSLRAREPALRVADSPPELVAFMQTDDDRHAAKDEVLRALVRTTRSKAPEAQLATDLLWAMFARRLRGIVRWRQWVEQCSEAESLSSVATTFADAVAKLDLRRVRRVAATLTRNVRRDRSRAHALETQHALQCPLCAAPEKLSGPRVVARTIGATPTAANDNTVPDDPDPEPDPEPDPGPKPPPLETLVGVLVDALGPTDAGLLLATAVLGQTQQLAGARFGLSHEATRKRIQRCLPRARRALSTAMSHSGAAPALKKVRL
jgi:DNA-directed RNA polymerase specialized sigma24 family protein